VSTIRDVARAAGVSIATVSRVFNGANRVSEAAQRRVREAALELDYWPNVAARSLIKSRTYTLGVLLPDLYGEFFSDVIRAIDHAAGDAKHQILLACSHADANEFLSAARSMRGRVDGLIAMVSDRHSAAAVARITRYFPVVLLNPRSHVDGCSAVSIANLDGAYSMVEHLLSLGHRQIAMIKGPAGTGDAERRLQGYRKALRDAGCKPQPSMEYAGDFTESSGYRAALEMLQKSQRPSALFAANDYMAVGAMSALRDAGIEVPRHMAVTGFDDIATVEYLSPPLTTVRVDAYELGVRAIELWMSRSVDSAPCQHQVLPTKLVVRGSCGSTRARAADTRERRRRPRRQARPDAIVDNHTHIGSNARNAVAPIAVRRQRATAPRTSRSGRPQP
jgi:LacI family transcriptional regulator